MADVQGAVDRLLKDLEYALSFVEAHKSHHRTSQTKAFLVEHIAKLQGGDLRQLDAIAGYFAPTSTWDDLGSDDGKTQCSIGAQVADSVRYLRWHQDRQGFNDRWIRRLKGIFQFHR